MVDKTPKDSGKIKFPRPSKVIMRISNCGTDVCNSGYKKMEGTNALIIGLNGVSIMSNDFAGKERAHLFAVDLACTILGRLGVKDPEKLLERIKNHEDLIKRWELVIDG